MKKVQITISAILLTTFMACHETDKKDNVTNAPDTAVVKQDDEISSKEKQATNFRLRVVYRLLSVVPICLSSKRHYQERYYH